MMKKLFMLVMCTMVTACSGANLDQLRNTPLQENTFQGQLALQYKTLAEEERQEGRYAVSEHIAQKGLMSAEGTKTMADALVITKDYHGDANKLKDGRALLDGLFLTNVQTTYPTESAQAQMLYDCWIMRAESNAPSERTMHCKQQFHNRITWLRDKVQHAPETESTAKKGKADSYSVLFDWDKSMLSITALRNFRQISEEIIATEKPYALAVNGHADTSGAAEYNMQLSEKRAETIANLLATYGVPEEVMTIFAFGETDLAVPTGDNVREPANRRVELFIE